jgi:hypothetical protein
MLKEFSIRRRLQLRYGEDINLDQKQDDDTLDEVNI